jgi:hypothetical protein
VFADIEVNRALHAPNVNCGALLHGSP